MSNIYYPTCNLVIADPTCSPCPPKELGRVRAVAFVLNSYTFVDITSPTEWADAYCNKNVFIFPFTQGDVSWTPNKENGFGNQKEELVSYDITVKFMLPDVQNTWDFLNQIKKTYNYRLVWKTETLIYQSAVPVTASPTLPIADDIKSRVKWNVECTMTQEDLPQPITAPAGIFDQCIGC